MATKSRQKPRNKGQLPRFASWLRPKAAPNALVAHVATQLRREHMKGVVPSPRARGGHLVAHTVHEASVADVDLGTAFGLHAFERRFDGRALVRTGQLRRLARGNQKRLPKGTLGGELFRRRGMVGTVVVDGRVLRRQLGHVWILGVSERVGRDGEPGTDDLCLLAGTFDILPADPVRDGAKGGRDDAGEAVHWKIVDGETRGR